MIKGFWVTALLISVVAQARGDQDCNSKVTRMLETLKAVDLQGVGNSSAAEAWKGLVQSDGDVIPEILLAMNDANELAANWLRSAIDGLVERVRENGESLPLVALGDYLLHTSNHPRGRRLAYELIQQSHPKLAQQLIPGLLHDPSLELRRDAVSRLMDRARELAPDDSAAAIVLYGQALRAARDVDQANDIADRMRELGEEIDTAHLFGFLRRWKVIGPFDNSGRAGFEVVYPPENKIDLSATYNGKSGPVGWTDHATADPYGMLDVNQAYGPLKEVVAYASSEFFSDEDRRVELRLGCKNAWKVWLNGELLFGRDEYHRAIEIDQYKLAGRLNKGRNVILVKVCQNEEEKDWTKQWEFQLRVSDELGTAIHSRVNLED